MTESTALTTAGNDWLRDHVVAGLPASGDNEPEKSAGRAVIALIDTALSSLGVNGAIAVKKATRSALFADLAHGADTLAVVYNDATPAYNGIYAKSGGSGSGAWAITPLALPASFGTQIAEALASIEGVAVDRARAESAADAAEVHVEAAQTASEASEAGASSAAGSATNAATSAAQANAAREQAQAARAQAVNAAQAAGVSRFYDTKAAATADLANIADLQVVHVWKDEGRGDHRTAYRKESGALVFKAELDSLLNPTITGDLVLAEGAILVPDTLPIRIGTNAMPSLGTEGTFNYPGASIAIGLDAGFSNVEGGITVVGWQAGMYAGAVGDESAITAMGWQALKHTTTGHATAFGWAAGRFNTTGHIATFGDESSGSNTTGITAALGYYAAFGNVTGLVTAVGYLAGRFSGPDTQMTIMGHEVALYNTAASLTAIGHRAATNNTSGTGNTVVGHEGFFNNTTGALNTAVGINGLFGNTAGSENAALGANAGRSITTGDQNTFLGAYAGFDASQKVDAANSVAIGYAAYTDYDNQVVLGNASVTRTVAHGNLGVNGRRNPAIPLDVRANDTPGAAVNIKNDAGYGLAVRINDDADDLGYGAPYRHAIHYNGGGESFAIVEGSNERLVIAHTTGFVGIGTDTPEYAFDVAGPIGFTPGSSVTPAQNGDVVFELSSNTSLTVKAKGSDGTVRTNVLTLA